MIDDLDQIETELEYATTREGQLRSVKPRVTSKSALLSYDQLET